MGIFAHFDIDAFYAQVEQRKNPSLKGKPVLVGGNSLRRSVVASASYEARPYGIRAGMPLFMARRLCPNCIIVHPDFKTYQEYSRRFYRLLYSLSPDLEIISQDEAVVDLSRCRVLYPDPILTVRNWRRKIVRELGITVSAGMGSSKLVAKLAASRAKPDGFLYIPREQEEEFLKTFPLEEIPGIGRKTLIILENQGIRSVGALMKTSALGMKNFLGKKGEELVYQVKGLDLSGIIPGEKPKSVSRGYTLEHDITSLEEAKSHLLYLSDSVAMRLRREGAKGGRICLRIRRGDFSEVQKCRSISPPTSDTMTIYRTVYSLAKNIIGGFRIRLLSVEASSLSYTKQPLLFISGEEKIMEAIEKIRRKYGFSSIKFLNEATEEEYGVFVFRTARKLIQFLTSATSSFSDNRSSFR